MKTTPLETRIELRIDPDLARRAHKEADKQRLSLSAWVRQLILRALDEVRRRPIGLAVLLMLTFAIPARAQDVSSQFGPYPRSGWALSTRGVTTFPVPMFRPTTPDTRIAMDFSPNGNPTPGADGMLAWGDGCKQDLSADPYTRPPLQCFRFGIGVDRVEFGQSLFGGAEPLPVYISLGVNNPRIILNPDGSVSSPGINGQVVSGRPVCIDDQGKLGACAQ